jgi:hypothetical protein
VIDRDLSALERKHATLEDGSPLSKWNSPNEEIAEPIESSPPI